MKKLITFLFLSLPILAWGQSKPPRFIDTCKMELDTPHHDKKGDFNIIIHGSHKDTIRNGIYEYQAIKKRVKN